MPNIQNKLAFVWFVLFVIAFIILGVSIRLNESLAEELSQSVAYVDKLIDEVNDLQSGERLQRCEQISRSRMEDLLELTAAYSELNAKGEQRMSELRQLREDLEVLKAELRDIHELEEHEANGSKTF